LPFPGNSVTSGMPQLSPFMLGVIAHTFVQKTKTSNTNIL
jgi:hypothetical protein